MWIFGPVDERKVRLHTTCPWHNTCDPRHNSFVDPCSHFLVGANNLQIIAEKNVPDLKFT